MSESIGPDASLSEHLSALGPTEPEGHLTAASVDEGQVAASDDPPELERRAFVRQMTTDAVGMAGRLVGFSRVITRSATAAGQAMISELGAIQAAVPDPAVGAPKGFGPGSTTQDASQPSDDGNGGGFGGAVGVAAATVDPPPAATATPPPEVAPERIRPRAVLDAEQAAVLVAASRAIVAVNQAGFPPQLTAATIHWDGEVIRFPTVGWSRRTTQLRADPKIGLLIDDPTAGVFLAVSGTARILEAHHARAAMEPLLRREAADADEAERRWQALLAEDRDRAVIVVELDQVLTGRR